MVNGSLVPPMQTFLSEGWPGTDCIIIVEESGNVPGILSGRYLPWFFLWKTNKDFEDTQEAVRILGVGIFLLVLPKAPDQPVYKLDSALLGQLTNGRIVNWGSVPLVGISLKGIVSRYKCIFSNRSRMGILIIQSCTWANHKLTS